jgi:hypothetical protein
MLVIEMALANEGWGYTRIRDALVYACDFFGVEALGLFGTVRYMVFFVIQLKTRAVEVAGIRVDPDGEWMKQMARNLVDPVEGFLRGATHLIHDRDPLFTEAFIAILEAGGVECVKIPARSPNCNPHAERFVKTMKYECLNQFVIFGERHLHEARRRVFGHHAAPNTPRGPFFRLRPDTPESSAMIPRKWWCWKSEVH